MLAELGHPESCFASVQVAGTNGKTSTSRYTAALLRGEGLCCGLYTSPHLVDYTERVEVNAVPVSHEAFARGISWALSAWDRLCDRDATWAEQGCTEFELLTVAAMAIFAEACVDVAVLEVGLGGRWDATSAVPTIACAVTGIGLDHTAILGDTLEAIAREKAAVIHRGAACVLGVHATHPAGVRDVMLARCASECVTPTFVARKGDALVGTPCTQFDLVEEEGGADGGFSVEVTVDAVGRRGVPIHAAYPPIHLRAPLYQAQNVACALSLATSVLGYAPSFEKVLQSLSGCPIPGRFEVVSQEPLIVLDACHNPQSAEAFALALQGFEPDRLKRPALLLGALADEVVSQEPLIVLDACHNPQSAEAFALALQGFEPDRLKRPALLLGALADKDHRGIVEVIVPLFDRIVVTQSSSGRAYPAEALAREVEEVCGRPPEAVCPQLEDAVSYLDGESYFCCGTITLIGELKEMLG